MTKPSMRLLDTAFPRPFLMATLTHAHEHLERAVEAIATGDIPSLREHFAKYLAHTRAASETLADAIKQIEQERR